MVNNGGVNINIGDINSYESNIDIKIGDIAIENSNNQLESLLNELKLLIDQMLTQVPQSQHEQINRDFKNFADEIQAPSPRKQWYELSAKGIIEAAKTCAEIVQPITKVVSCILSIL